MQIDQRNLIIAIVLSIGIVLGFEFFYNLPRLEKQKALDAERGAQQNQTETTAPAQAPAAPAATPAPTSTPVVPGAAANAAAPAVPASRQPRVQIDTPSVSGSIDLVGGR